MMTDMLTSGAMPLTKPQTSILELTQLLDSYLDGTKRGGTVVAEADGKLLGALLCGEHLAKTDQFNAIGTVCAVWGAWVEEQARDEGLAGRLWEWIRPKLSGWGFTHMVTAVAQGNDPAHFFALRAGAKPYETRYLLTLDPEGW
jgi:GNAT superfamily N-acetyltransferase